MPRPGPRPYDCVRRAWHSERHHPIRGSLIQEIFRLANEVHDPATLKNKEWLEKLPLVVLKAEEIMYSKANSEAEYMDLNTLWERANDAIDTIIRRDDAPETDGDLLQPCIEAALSLGCIPRRASRSQRHNNPGCYLSSVNKEAQHLVSSVGHLLRLIPLPPPHSSGQQSSLSRLESWYAAVLAANRPNRCGIEVNSVVPDGSLESKDANPLTNSLLHCQDGGAYNCPSLGGVYPLNYSDEQPMAQDPTGSTMRSLPSVCEDGTGLLFNFIGSESAKGALKTGSIFGEASKPATDSECDLSLRLGLFSPPSSESAWLHEVEDVGSSSSCNGSKYSDPSSGGARGVNFGNSFSSSKDKGVDFINIDSSDEPFESLSSKWSSEEEGIAIRHGF